MGVRKTLNENPVVQVVMLGILGIVVAFLFMTRVMGGSEAATDAAPDAAATTPASSIATTTPPDTTPTAGDTASAPPEVAASAGAGFKTGAGLPRSVVSAHERGDVVAILVVNSRGTEDGRLKAEIQALRGRGDTSVFVVEAKDVARYSRIAEGVNLDRVPGLVVIQPKRLADAELPTATITYGFRGADSLQQAVRDVLYKGKDLPYHPG